VALLSLLALAAMAQGEDPDQPRADRGQIEPADVADKHYRAGLAKQSQAEMAPREADARHRYLVAAAEYKAAVDADPDHALSQLLWATCLTQLIPLTSDSQARLRLVLEADRRFEAASRCSEPEPVVFERWASFMMGTLYNYLSDAEQRHALLQKTVAVCQRGFELVDEPTPRAQLERHLGSALMWSAGHSSDRPEQLRLLEQAVSHLQRANQSITVRQTLHQNGYFGIALLSLGRARQDLSLLRDAAAEFETALKFYPNQYATHYSLAATWSLLGDTEQAAEHLAVAIDHDPAGEVARRAATDPDLVAVRNTPAYTAALDRRRRRLAEAQAAKLFRQALRAQQSAERTNDAATATALLQQATTLYQQTVAATPDHYPAQALFATALAQLANLSAPHPDQQRQYLDAARARFATAAQCPEVDPQLYDQWSTFLLAACYPLLTSPVDQQLLLTDARRVLTAGVQRARFSGLRGRLETQLGTTLVLLAQTCPAPNGVGSTDSMPRTNLTERSHGSATLPPEPGATPSPTSLYVEALEHFRAAEVAEQSTRSANYYELWGIALLRVGQATKQPMLVRQATERLLKSLELRADNPTVHYNLACVYAQLRQPNQALRHLERSLARDPQGLFYTNAERDPDLEPLRRTEAFRRLFHQHRPVGQGDHPTISEK
ncbi:tetratricopeptide repeat protein, partial [bacterium]|nr:tetratricopeptide repeat protein [bacterium]